MQTKSMLMTLLLATLVSVSSVAGAEQQNKEPTGNMPGAQKMDQGMRPGDMQGGGMMAGGMGGGAMQGGMMDMMKGCHQMVSNTMMPQLPPGNEKLQLQMQAEMMQKMGEILGQYAAKIKDE